MRYLIYYLLFINIVTFIIYGVDKKKAEDHKWRIRESTLLGLAAIGGPVGALLGMRIFHHKTKKKKFYITVPALIILWMIVIFLAYCLPYYHTVDAPLYQSDNTVQIIDERDYIFYDGPGKDKAMIFYPGAKVDEKAYEALLYETAEEGIDCFLVKMPFHIAFFGKNRADEIIENYSYKEWIMAGHSLGGAMASSYLKGHEDKFSGMIFLASFASSEISDDSNLDVLSVYGSEDKVLKRGSYEAAKKWCPQGSFTEKIIEGGNHSGFAYYGPQSGDGEATISKQEQIDMTVDYILATF